MQRRYWVLLTVSSTAPVVAFLILNQLGKIDLSSETEYVVATAILMIAVALGIPCGAAILRLNEVKRLGAYCDLVSAVAAAAGILFIFDDVWHKVDDLQKQNDQLNQGQILVGVLKNVSELEKAEFCLIAHNADVASCPYHKNLKAFFQIPDNSVLSAPKLVSSSEDLLQKMDGVFADMSAANLQINGSKPEIADYIAHRWWVTALLICTAFGFQLIKLANAFELFPRDTQRI
jgi:hypothetical protein